MKEIRGFLAGGERVEGGGRTGSAQQERFTDTPLSPGLANQP